MIDAYAHLDMTAQDPLADLASRMDEAEVSKALVVETWSGDNRRCLDDLLASPQAEFRVALCFRPEDGESMLPQLRSPVLRALRVRTQDMYVLRQHASILEESGKWLLPHAENGIEALLQEIVSLAKECPQIKVYLPHLGWPVRDGVIATAWQPAMTRLMELPNILVGISAIAHFSKQAFPHEDVRPFVSQLAAMFDRESLVIGSDYPLFEKTQFAQYMQLASEWLGGEGPSLRRAESLLWGEGFLSPGRPDQSSQ